MTQSTLHRRALFVAPWLALVLVSATILPAVASATTADDAPAWSPEDSLPALGRAMLADATAAKPRAEALAADALAAGTSLSALLDASLAHVHEAPLAPVDAPASASLLLALVEAHTRVGDPLAPLELLSLARQVMALPPAVAEACAILVAGASAADAARGDAWRDVTAEDLAVLARHIDAGKPYVAATSGDAQLALLGGHPTDLLQAEAALAKIDIDAITTAHRIMARAVDAAVARLGGDDVGIAVAAPQRIGSPYGDIVISGTGPDTHADDRFVSIDQGGDDLYVNRAGAVRAEILELLTLTPPPDATSPAFQPWAEHALDLIHRAHNASISIDLDGADTYASRTQGTQGFGGFGGFGALVDLGGKHDSYTADRFAQGAGVLAGAGFLVDDGGNEPYVVDRQGQGYGHDLGAGFLADARGTDTYTAFVLAQGTGYSVNLAGMLVDGTGDDTYQCNGVLDFSASILPVNAPRPGSICHAAGFGGVGTLIDGAGSDLYTTVAAFQAMTLVGVGVLVDLGGSDRYLAGEWSNGMAVLGAAVLIDATGDDAYSSVQVETAPWADIYLGSNGEGYLGVGVLVDGQGSDSYLSDVRKDLWLPQYACGAGCAFGGGAGVLVDGAGDDTYVSELGQGGAILGIGVLVDAAGSDVYTLTRGSIQGQGFADTGILNVVAPIEPAACYYGVLYDLDGGDSYNNPVTTFGARGDDTYWGQNDFGRGIDGLDGTTAYLTSEQFRSDVDLLVGSHACEMVSGPAMFVVCTLLDQPPGVC